MSAIALARLGEERKNWRKDHPNGFYAKPVKKNDNSINLMKWEIGIPGKEDTDWAGGVYKVIMEFPNEYPTKPPYCKFDPPIYHPNVFTSGAICLSLLKEGDGWRPAITIKQLAIGIQDLFDNPNPHSPANTDANNLYLRKKADYSRRIREQAKKHAEEVVE